MKVTKQFKIGIISIIAIGLIGGLFTFNDYLSKEKRWFYSTATNVKAFDKLYWGMSKEEVERALNKRINFSNNPKKGDLPLDFEIRMRESAKNDFKYTTIINDYKRVILQNNDFDFYGENIDKLILYFYKNQLCRFSIDGKLWSYEMNYKKLRHFDSLIVKDLNIKYGNPKNELDKKDDYWIKHFSWDNKKASLYYLIKKPNIVQNQNGEMKSYEFEFYISATFLQIDKSIDEDIINYKPESF